jgi:D-glucosaminate-6-phosphate ammonia-lyase
MKERIGTRSLRWNRRDLIRAGSLAVAAVSGTPAVAAAATAPAENPSVYTDLGVKPFINTTATLTINGGSRQLDEVIAAIEAAGRFHVNLDELMEKAGERLSTLLKCEWAMVTSGAAAALSHATAACVAGADPEAMQQLPDLRGLKNEVIIPKWARNQYDHAIRAIGVTIVEVETPEQARRAVSGRTAMIAMLGDKWQKETVTLDDFAEISRHTGIPILIDAAADPLVTPDPYLSRGASLVAYSGGKILRGPQTAGLLLGKKDLVRAAFLNSAPHHAVGRALKVSKEEIVGIVKAVEVWVQKRNLEAEHREWESWYAHITAEITRVAGVRTKVNPPQRGGPFPTLLVEWDESKIALTAGQVGKLLMAGEPRIQSHAAGDGASFLLRPVAMKPHEHKIVATRLREIFEAHRGSLVRPTMKTPLSNVAGNWDVAIEFTAGKGTHKLHLETSGNQVRGVHTGRFNQGDLAGAVSGDEIRFTSTLPTMGAPLAYTFAGRVSADTMSGELDCGEHGKAKWTAVRHQAAKARRDPAKA